MFMGICLNWRFVSDVPCLGISSALVTRWTFIRLISMGTPSWIVSTAQMCLVCFLPLLSPQQWSPEQKENGCWAAKSTIMYKVVTVFLSSLCEFVLSFMMHCFCLLSVYDHFQFWFVAWYSVSCFKLLLIPAHWKRMSYQQFESINVL